MKEMVYSKRFEIPVILEENFYKGFHYACINQGSHPCCYVELPSEHPYYLKKDFSKINCHGGVTFSGDLAHPDLLQVGSGFWIGWDYGHVGDYIYSVSELFIIHKDGKKYTTEELVEDCHNVIDQLDLSIRLDLYSL